MCGYECFIYAKSIHSSFLSLRGEYLKILKYQIQNAQNRRSGEKSIHKYETNKNSVISHGRHIYAKTSDMAQDTMCSYRQSDHVLPYCKFVLRCCADCPCINIPDQETDN